MMLIAALGLSLVCCGCGKAARKHYETSGRFSYDPPAGWNRVPTSGAPNAVYAGDPWSGFAPTVTTFISRSPESLAEFADMNVGDLASNRPDMGLVSREEFETSDGQAGIKLVVNATRDDFSIRLTHYLLSSGSKKFVMTCGTHIDTAEKLAPIFDKCAASFRIH